MYGAEYGAEVGVWSGCIYACRVLARHVTGSPTPRPPTQAKVPIQHHVHANRPLRPSNTLDNAPPYPSGSPALHLRRGPSLLPHLCLAIPPPPARSTRPLPLGKHVPDPQVPTLGSNGQVERGIWTHLHDLDGSYQAGSDRRKCGDCERVVGQKGKHLEFEAANDHDQ